MDRAGEGDRGQRRLHEDDRFTLMGYAHFRAAADYIAAAFAAIPSEAGGVREEQPLESRSSDSTFVSVPLVAPVV